MFFSLCRLMIMTRLFLIRSVVRHVAVAAQLVLVACETCTGAAQEAAIAAFAAEESAYTEEVATAEAATAEATAEAATEEAASAEEGTAFAKTEYTDEVAWDAFGQWPEFTEEMEEAEFAQEEGTEGTEFAQQEAATAEFAESAEASEEYTEEVAWEAFGKSEDMEPWQWPESTEIGGCGAVLCIIHDFIIMLLQIPMAHQFVLH